MANLPPGRLEQPAFRHQSPSRDPLSGEGARAHGGRYNPKGSFPVLYLALSEQTSACELHRAGSRHAVGAAGLLPREVFRYEVALDDVLDLRDTDVLKQLSLSAAALTADDLALTRSLGTQAHALGFEAIVAPSACGAGDIVAVLVDHAQPLRLKPELWTVWTSVDQLGASAAA